MHIPIVVVCCTKPKSGGQSLNLDFQCYTESYSVKKQLPRQAVLRIPCSARLRPALLPLSAEYPRHPTETHFAVTPCPEGAGDRDTARCTFWLSRASMLGTPESVAHRGLVKILRYFTSAWRHNSIILQLRRSNAMSAVEETKIVIPSVQVCIEVLKK